MKPMAKSSRFSRKVVENTAPGNDESLSVDYDEMVFTDVDKNPKKSEESFSSSKVLKKGEVQKLMDDRRESVQAVAISEDNKGFKLLQKFGYSASQGGLGKLNTGLVVPITVTKRAADDRAGLGVFELKKKKIEEKVVKEAVKVKLADNMVRNFKSEMILQSQVLLVTKHLNNASKVMVELDYRSGVTENHLWPVVASSDESEEHSETEPNVDDQNIIAKLEESLQYLKHTYYYCIHCGFQYGNLEEFERDCPGPSEDDH